MGEEAGIQVPITFMKKHHYIGPDEQEMVGLYKTVYNGPFKPNHEVDCFEFMMPEQIMRIKDQLTPCCAEDLKQLKIL
jgi:hypothetical protein